MNTPLIIFGIIFMMVTASSHATGLFSRFSRPDGAITVLPQGNLVDPYFTNKALIIAWEAGLDVSAITRNWLIWLLPRQRADGGFDRYCSEGATWYVCKSADADDSTAATFLHLNVLYSNALQRQKSIRSSTVADLPVPAVELAVTTKKSIGMLLRLRTTRGTYRAFADKPIEFFMDNTEVYASLIATGRHVQALQLKESMEKYFHVGSDWQPANEAYQKFEFYPSALATTYRWHTGLVDKGALESEFGAWAKLWGAAWLNRSQDEYAWGLVAWGARSIADQHWIRCWRYKHDVVVRNLGWTIVDEAVDMGLAHLGVQPVAQSCESVLDKK
jgi:hypothetical protein